MSIGLGREVLRQLEKDLTTEHLHELNDVELKHAEARRHLEKTMNEAKGIKPANGPQTPLRKEGEV